MRKQCPRQMAGCDICDGYQPFICVIWCRALGCVRAAVCPGKLQIAQNLGGLAVERRKGAEKAEHDRDQERGAGGAGRLCRHKDKGDFHDPGDDKGGGKRPRGYAEQTVASPMSRYSSA